MIEKIRKRDGRIVSFDQEKITTAILKAARASGGEDETTVREISDRVVKTLKKRFKELIPSVEDIQDIVEETLIETGHSETAKAYILYRQKRQELREAKRFFVGVKDELKLSLNAVKVLERRYLQKNEKGEVIETPKEMFERVAKSIAETDKEYGKDYKKTEEEFYKLMTSFEFLPNSPTLMNAGTPLGQLAACFVLPVEDTMEGIFETVKNTALIHKTGGGTGFSFSRLRPKNDVVRSTGGIASGPVSFMRVFDVATDVIKQGGRRRGANMGILRVDHPDIMEFITCKQKEGSFINFNLSVGITEDFMEKVRKNENYSLINPKTKKETGKLKAKDVFDLIATMAWQNGDPGIVFLDRLNRTNPTPSLGEIEATNPCGEQPLLPYEACNLGSINLSKMLKDGRIDYEKLKDTVRISIHFLDNVIDVSRYPLKRIEEMVKGNRKIGLGVMGFADMLLELGIPYNSEEALSIASEVMSFISKEARRASEELAEERGPFPNFKKSIYKKPLRNATLTTIAPTGTISIIAHCSSGIEPLFALVFIRSVMENTQLLEINPVFEKIASSKGLYSHQFLTEVAKTGSIQNMERIPEDIKRVFVTALDIAPEWHIRMQATFQKWVDNAVSKTVNLPSSATPEDVKKIFWLAYELGVKGVTIYRIGSRKEEVLSTRVGEYLLFDSEYTPCPTCVG